METCRPLKGVIPTIVEKNMKKEQTLALKTSSNKNFHDGPFEDKENAEEGEVKILMKPVSLV